METNNLENLLKEHILRDQARLDRIEVKIDKLSETLVALARAEEKLATLEFTKVEVSKRLDEHEVRLDTHSDRLNAGAVTINTINKIFWVTTAAVAAALAQLYLR